MYPKKTNLPHRNLMKIIIQLIFILIILVVSACTTTTALTSNVKSSQVTDVQYFEPISVIYQVKTKSAAVYNDSISKKSKAMQFDIMQSMKDKIRVSNIIYWQDSAISKHISR